MKTECYTDVIEYNKQDVIIHVDSNVWFYTLPYKDSNRFFITLIYNAYTEYDFIEDYTPQNKDFKPLKAVKVYFSDHNIISLKYTFTDHEKTINMESSKIPSLYGKYIEHEREVKKTKIESYKR